MGVAITKAIPKDKVKGLYAASGRLQFESMRAVK